MWSSGDPILVRSVFRSRVRFAFPHTLVKDDGHCVAFSIRPGTRGKWIPRDVQGRYIDRWVRGDSPSDHVWSENRILWLAKPGEAHSLGLLWRDDTDEFLGWYVQLQAPLKRISMGFDTTDHALDVWVSADGRWSWKDEGDFSDAQELGAFSPDEAAAIRAEGERVIGDWPFPTGWEEWRPDPAWPVPELPAGWDVI